MNNTEQHFLLLKIPCPAFRSHLLMQVESPMQAETALTTRVHHLQEVRSQSFSSFRSAALNIW